MLYIYLVLSLLVTMFGAFTDISSGRVKNIHLIFAIAIWLCLIISESIISHSLVFPVFLLSINVILAFITALIFYLTDIWAPGDCKLYIVISLIYPIKAYVTREGNIFPALDFVIYAFALGYIVLIVIIATRKLKESKRVIKINNTALNLRHNHIFSILANLGTISAFNTIFYLYASEFFYANQMFCIIATIGFLSLLQQKADIIRKIIGAISVLYFLTYTITYNAWLNFFLNLVECILIAAVIEFINNRVYINTYKEISKEEVRPGMILSYSTLCAMQKCKDPELPQTTTENRRSRITERQAEAVKTWCKNAKSNIVIVETIPFAPFIASAVLLQIIRFLIFEH